MSHRKKEPGSQDHRLLDYFTEIQPKKQARSEIAVLLGCAVCAARLTETRRHPDTRAKVVLPTDKARLAKQVRAVDPVAYCSACWYRRREG